MKCSTAEVCTSSPLSVVQHILTYLPGELRHINRLRLWPLRSVLKEKYLMEASEADTLASFLGPMLNYVPDNRATASDLVNHPWLEGVVVQGELEMEERKRRGSLVAGAAAENGNSSAKQGGGGAGAVRAGVSLEDIAKLGPAVKGMVGMGRI